MTVNKWLLTINVVLCCFVRYQFLLWSNLYRGRFHLLPCYPRATLVPRLPRAETYCPYRAFLCHLHIVPKNNQVGSSNNRFTYMIVYMHSICSVYLPGFVRYQFLLLSNLYRGRFYFLSFYPRATLVPRLPRAETYWPFRPFSVISILCPNF